MILISEVSEGCPSSLERSAPVRKKGGVVALHFPSTFSCHRPGPAQTDSIQSAPANRKIFVEAAVQWDKKKAVQVVIAGSRLSYLTNCWLRRDFEAIRQTGYPLPSEVRLRPGKILEQ